MALVQRRLKRLGVDRALAGRVPGRVTTSGSASSRSPTARTPDGALPRSPRLLPFREQNESEVEGEGVRYAKEERYALMEEEVSILKALWTTRGPVHFEGKFHTLSGAHIRPRPLQQPFPKFYLGGGSRQAWEMSAKHSDVHLFWGDLPERIAANIAEIRQMARAHGRESAIGFGMRLQMICREDERDAGRPPMCWCATPASGRSRK